MSFVRQPNSVKWHGHKSSSYPLWLADSDIALDPALKKEIQNRLEKTNNFTYKTRPQSYFNAIIKWYGERHLHNKELALKPEHFIESPSINNLVYLSVQAHTQKDDGVLTLTPIFPNYHKIIRFLGRKVVESRMYNERDKEGVSRFDINWYDLEQKAKQAKMMIFNNPHNPSGRLWDKKEVTKVLALCKKYELFLLGDEILCDFVPDNMRKYFYSMVNSDYNRLIVSNSISKAFNMMSIRAGYAIIRDPTIRSIHQAVIDHMSLHVNEFGIACTQVIYSPDGKKWLERLAIIIRTNYNYLKQKLQKTMAVMSRYEGVFFVVLNFEAYLKFIERWFYSTEHKGQKSKMVPLYLEQKNIFGSLVPFFSVYQRVYTDLRWTLSVDTVFFKAFADHLVSVLEEVESKYRDFDARL